jgi:hypothetical protein
VKTSPIFLLWAGDGGAASVVHLLGGIVGDCSLQGFRGSWAKLGTKVPFACFSQCCWHPRMSSPSSRLCWCTSGALTPPRLLHRSLDSCACVCFMLVFILICPAIRCCRHHLLLFIQILCRQHRFGCPPHAAVVGVMNPVSGGCFAADVALGTSPHAAAEGVMAPYLWRMLCRRHRFGGLPSCRYRGCDDLLVALGASPHAAAKGVMAPVSGGCFAIVVFGWMLCRRGLGSSWWMLCHRGFIYFASNLALMYLCCRSSWIGSGGRVSPSAFLSGLFEV